MNELNKNCCGFFFVVARFAFVVKIVHYDCTEMYSVKQKTET